MNDNELIAEFMGAKFKNCGSYSVYSFDDFKTQTFVSVLQYDTSWNWLMPVVEKIGEYGVWTLRPTLAMFENYKGELRDNMKFSFRKGTEDFEEVDGEAVPWVFLVACVCVDFIKWYKEEK